MMSVELPTAHRHCKPCSVDAAAFIESQHSEVGWLELQNNRMFAAKLITWHGGRVLADAKLGQESRTKMIRMAWTKLILVALWEPCIGGRGVRNDLDSLLHTTMTVKKMLAL
jgi:hypothetical protein